jgi:hypothetical protein
MAGTLETEVTALRDAVDRLIVARRWKLAASSARALAKTLDELSRDGQQETD